MITDADFSVVGGPKRRSPWARFAWWCVGVLVKTAIGGLFALAVALLAVYGLGIHDDQQLHWVAIVITLAIFAGGAFLRGWFGSR